MTIKITIDCGNAAFEGHAAGEVARILQDFARTVRDHALEPGDTYRLHDTNGNAVGAVKVTR